MMHAIQLTTDMEEMYQSVAKATGRPLDDLIREALNRFLSEWEDRQDAEDADRLYLEFKESGEKGIPLDDVLREAGLTRADIQ